MKIEEIITEIKILESAEIEAQKKIDPNGFLWLALNDRIAALEEAISLLKTHPDNQPNEPLTVEDLMEMDGQPVWVEVSENWKKSDVSGGWCLVKHHKSDNKVRVYIYDTRFGATYFAQQDYRISWLAYRWPHRLLGQNQFVEEIYDENKT